jgi:hypothetical protein
MAHEQLAFGESERIDVASASLISYIFLVFCYVIIVSCIYHICRFSYENGLYYLHLGWEFRFCY